VQSERLFALLSIAIFFPLFTPKFLQFNGWNVPASAIPHSLDDTCLYPSSDALTRRIVIPLRKQHLAGFLKRVKQWLSHLPAHPGGGGGGGATAASDGAGDCIGAPSFKNNPLFTIFSNPDGVLTCNSTLGLLRQSPWFAL
jgi:hypothetical protein